MEKRFSPEEEMIKRREVPVIKGFNCEDVRSENNFIVIENYIAEHIKFFQLAFPKCAAAKQLVKYAYLAACEQAKLVKAGKRTDPHMFFDYLDKQNSLMVA